MVDYTNYDFNKMFNTGASAVQTPQVPTITPPQMPSVGVPSLAMFSGTAPAANSNWGQATQSFAPTQTQTQMPSMFNNDYSAMSKTGAEMFGATPPQETSMFGDMSGMDMFNIGAGIYGMFQSQTAMNNQLDIAQGQLGVSRGYLDIARENQDARNQARTYRG